MPNQIKLMGLTALPVALHHDFHHQTSSLIVATGAEKLHVESLYAEYKELVASEASLVRRQTTYVSTENLKTVDKERDNILGVTMQIICAHCASTIEPKRSAAMTLDALTAPYKGIGRSEYRSETREIAGLLSLLNTEEAMAHITTLHLTEEVEALSMKNAAFEIALSQKQEEEAKRTPQTSLNTEELRKLVDAKYAEIVQTVNAYAIVQPSEEIENFIIQMNALTTLTSRSAATMNKDEGKAEEEVSPGQTEGEESSDEPQDGESNNEDTLAAPAE